MSVTGEVSGVVLEYVARRIDGDIVTTKTKFDKKLGENVQQETAVEDPVIVFFPNKTVQVMSYSRAEQRGFTQQPEIMNFSQVEDQKTPAGRYKHAIRESDRRRAWEDLENAVITKAVSASGHPLPLDCDYSKNSLYLDDPVRDRANVDA